MSGGNFQAFVLLLLVIYCLGVFSFSPTGPLTCYYYSQNDCNDSGWCNQTNETCTDGQYCFAMWKNETGTPSVEVMGCWNSDDPGDCERTTCKYGKHTPREGSYFCCCNLTFCNEEIGVNTPAVPSRPTPTQTSPTTLPSTSSSSVPPPAEPRDKTKQMLLCLVLPIIGLIVIFVFGFVMYYRHKTPFPIPNLEQEPLHPVAPPSPDLGLRPIQLVEVISQGQFGTVWKADYLEDVVAVKVLPSSYKAAWACEKEIYVSCNMKHENILKFIAAEKHSDGQYVELWLVTQYHENGSLAGYLKRSVINWRELCGMAGSMATGLAYLHTEFYGAYSKPCIAHRDFKSKNVLVKKDLTCCLSDFGLAAKFQSGGDPGETHGQVGTRRYMAPEVLEGAINFTRESFLYIDVYAFALVLWELTSRCTAVDGPVEEYRLPFEEEVGSHPSLEDMQQAVVHKKMRPKFRIDWSTHSGVANLLQTIEECWDQDAEARLTAQCVAERVRQLQATSSSPSDHLPTVTTVVNDTNVTVSSRESTI